MSDNIDFLKKFAKEYKKQLEKRDARKRSPIGRLDKALNIVGAISGALFLLSLAGILAKIVLVLVLSLIFPNHEGIPHNGSINNVNNFSKEHFCKVEAYILRKNIHQLSKSVNLENNPAYDLFYNKSKEALQRIEFHHYSSYSNPKDAWRSIEAKADIGILHSTLSILKRSQNGQINAFLFYSLLERTNIILSMDKSYCGSPSWWPKQYPTSNKGMKKFFLNEGEES